MDVRALWDFDDPAASEERFRERLAGATDTDRLICLTQIARAQGLQRRFDEAYATLAEVPAVKIAPTTRWETYALLERGRVLNSSGRREEARPLFDLACAAPFDDLRIDALHMAAIVAEPEEALALNERAIAEAKASQDPAARRWLGSLLNNTGWTHHALGNYGRAFELFEDALKFREEQGDEGAVRIAKWCVARCLRSLGRLEEALAMQMELEPESGFVCEERGECLLALNRASEAAPWFKLAFQKLVQDSWLASSEPDRLARLESLGRSV